MHYTKPMIELVFEIRRRVNAQLKPGVKLANPNLLSELGDVYHSTKDTILRTLIKELLSSAGEDWQQLLLPNHRPGAHNVKVYRGQVSLEQKAAPAAETVAPASGKAGRYYRGVKIA